MAQSVPGTSGGSSVNVVPYLHAVIVMGHILGSDRILETAAVTAVRHPAKLTTGVLLVVFVSRV